MCSTYCPGTPGVGPWPRLFRRASITRMRILVRTPSGLDNLQADPGRCHRGDPRRRMWRGAGPAGNRPHDPRIARDQQFSVGTCRPRVGLTTPEQFGQHRIARPIPDGSLLRVRDGRPGRPRRPEPGMSKGRLNSEPAGGDRYLSLARRQRRARPLLRSSRILDRLSQRFPRRGLKYFGQLRHDPPFVQAYRFTTC